MTGGIMQLVAYGFEDMFITGDPQITYFKAVYKRHTNFSREQIPQNFSNTNSVNFGTRVSCSLGVNGDLIGNIFIVIKLPTIGQIDQTGISQIAWVHRIGFYIIKLVEIEINGHIIDRHYGEWLSIWSELVSGYNGDNRRGLLKMIGEDDTLTDFTFTKDEYTLYVPLQFWFCRMSGLYIPLLSLHYSDIKINIEFNDADKCYITAPTNYVECIDSVCNFTDYEYIEQNINGDIRAGLFIKYDISTQRLYYVKLTTNTLTGIPLTTYPITPSDILTYLYTVDAYGNISINADPADYKITGKTSGFIMFPDFNVVSVKYSFPRLRVNLKNCYLLVDYYFLDDEERVKIVQMKRDYLIEQLFFTPDVVIDGITRSSKIVMDQPCKLMVWVIQMKYNINSKDYFNYSNSYQHKISSDTNYPNNDVGDVVGGNIALNETVILNGYERVSFRDSNYFNMIQPYQHFKYAPQIGINVYSFGLHPELIQPSGSCNMSQIDNILIKTKTDATVTSSNYAVLRCYGLSYNILRVSSGIAGVVFSR